MRYIHILQHDLCNSTCFNSIYGIKYFHLRTFTTSTCELSSFQFSINEQECIRTVYTCNSGIKLFVKALTFFAVNFYPCAANFHLCVARIYHLNNKCIQHKYAFLQDKNALIQGECGTNLILCATANKVHVMLTTTEFNSNKYLFQYYLPVINSAISITKTFQQQHSSRLVLH